jgi:hypothetical protein
MSAMVLDEGTHAVRRILFTVLTLKKIKPSIKYLNDEIQRYKFFKMYSIGRN